MFGNEVADPSRVADRTFIFVDRCPHQGMEADGTRTRRSAGEDLPVASLPIRDSSAYLRPPEISGLTIPVDFVQTALNNRLLLFERIPLRDQFLLVAYIIGIVVQQ